MSVHEDTEQIHFHSSLLKYFLSLKYKILMYVDLGCHEKMK
jgi:hypothetical protein